MLYVNVQLTSGAGMGKSYRSWAERRQIISSIIADSNPPPIDSFQLTPSEEVYYRSRSARAVSALARKSSSFKSYYSLPTAKPFGYVLGVTSLIVAGAVSAAIYVRLNSHASAKVYPLLAACATVTVAAIGWAVAGWISHRNTVRQNTNNMLFARFSQATFGDALHRFHTEFGNDSQDRITPERVSNLRLSGNEDDRKSATSVTYILNYYEFIASGVIKGDLNQHIIRENIRGVIIYYYDKCEPLISHANKLNPLVYQNLIKIRTHYREP